MVKLSFFNQHKGDDVAKYDTVVRNTDDPTPPFRMEFAPGVIVIDAEIRDRASLDVFVAALQAMGALLPVELPAPADVLPDGGKPMRDEISGTIDVTPKASDPMTAGGTPFADIHAPA